MAVETEHSWVLTCIVSISTCSKCGLLKIKTLDNEYYFTQLEEPYLRCKHSFFKDLNEGVLKKSQDAKREQKTKKTDGSGRAPS